MDDFIAKDQVMTDTPIEIVPQQDDLKPDEINVEQKRIRKQLLAEFLPILRSRNRLR